MERLVVGVLTRPHGVRGALVVQTGSSAFDALRPGLAVALDADNDQETIATRIVSVRAHRAGAVVELAGICDRTSAEAMIGRELSALRSDLPRAAPRQYYVCDLLGMTAYSAGGDRLGEICEVVETGANDVWVVRTSAGELLVPAISGAIREVDLEARKVVIDPDTAMRSVEQKRHRE